MSRYYQSTSSVGTRASSSVKSVLRSSQKWDTGLAPLVNNVEEKLYYADEIVSLEGFKKMKSAKLSYIFACVLTLGIWWVITRFVLNDRWRILLTDNGRCPLGQADVVLIRDGQGRYHKRKVKRIKIEEEFYGGLEDKNAVNCTKEIEYLVFEFQHQRYLYDREEDNFFVQHMDPYDILNSPSTTKKTGLSHAEHLLRLIAFGSNHIDTKKGHPLSAVIAELQKPVHLFQILVFALFITKGYYVYSTMFLFLVIISFILNVFRKNDSRKIVKQLIKTYGPEIRVIRDGQSFMAGSASLVPGDLVQITGRITLPCDLVLIEGTMDVDESTLTGDTVPAQKVPFQGGDANEALRSSSAYIQQENILIGGTRVLSVKSCCAVVIRTGFNTSRGKVIRTLLSQKQDTGHNYASDLNYLTITLMVSSFFNTLVAVIWKYFYLSRENQEFKDYIDLFICTVPPFLPLVLIMPLYIAAHRLRKFRVKCTSLLGLMKMGTVDCICYDKTGTMTEESLALYGAIETQRRKRANVGRPPFAPIRTSAFDMSRDTITIMAACHNLVRVNDKVMGDKLEEALFRTCGYELKREKSENRFLVHPPPHFNDRGTIQVTSIYPFSSTLRRMSVVTRIPSYCVYTKGSPNSIKSICDPNTIPSNYDDTLKQYGLLGYRIIAMARRPLRDEDFFKNLERNDIESNMQFLGFLVMKTQLYPDMDKEIKKLKNSSIACKVITGDTVFTAVSVAIESNMIDKHARVLSAEAHRDEGNNISVIWKEIHRGTEDKTELAITGSAFSLLRDYCTDQYQKISYYRLIARTNVFAEMLAAQKAELIQDLKEMDYTVAMVGDGSNDSMAINVSDVGVSVTDAETSYAAQFSIERGRQCCAQLIQDGRALLDKILYNVKFLIVFVFIQFAVILLNQLRVPRERQLIWSNIIMGFVLTLSVSFNHPVNKLHKQRPSKYVVRVPILLSIIGQIIIQVTCLACVMVWMKFSSFYHDYEYYFGYDANRADIPASFLFLFSNFQYLAVAFAFQFNYRYIVPWRNYLFIIFSVVFLAVNIVILFPIPSPVWIFGHVQQVVWINIFQMDMIDFNAAPDLAWDFVVHRWITLPCIALNFFISWMFEFLCVRIGLFYKKQRIARDTSLIYEKLMISSVN